MVSRASIESAPAAAAPPVIATREEAIERARALLPRIAERARMTEEDRVVPAATIAELTAAGLLNLVTPRIFGGAELGFADLVRVTAELASACGSTGWVYGVLAGHSWLLNLFPIEAAQEVFGDPNALTATVFRLGGEVTEVAGGYRLVNGDGRFCSGIDHASWVIVGNAVKRSDGTVEPRFFLIPRSDVEIVDDWFTAGMRGTGSRSIRIKESFIPAYRSCSLKDMLEGTAPGAAAHRRALYRMPFADVAPFSIIGAPLGIARGAIRSFAASLEKGLSGKEELQIAEQSASFARLAEASADIDAAFALVVEDAARIDTAEAALPPLERARIPRDWAYAAQKSRYAVTRLFEASGGSGIYDGSTIQRMWRDVNGAAQHFAFGWDSAMTSFGRAAAGLQPGSFALKGRG